MVAPLLATRVAAGTIGSYALLIPIGIVGGQMAAFAAGAVASTGFFNPYAVFVVFTLGDILTDSIYYYLGRFRRVQAFAHRYGHKIGLEKPHFAILHQRWFERTFRTMLISKYGLAFTGPLLISAGMARLPARRFYAYAIAISIAQYAIFVPLGFYFAKSFTTVSYALKALQIVAALLIFIYVFTTFRRLAHASLQERPALTSNESDSFASPGAFTGD